jgi:glycine cleavage system H protein
MALPEVPDSLYYERSRFRARLPVAYRYSPSHFWLGQEETGVWRVGFTKFATRMLGEIVEYHFDANPGERIAPGQVIGWVEGFKALTEIVCVASGEFGGANPVLKEDITLIFRDPHGEGWLYRVRGEPDATCVDAEGYRGILDAIIE